MKKLTLGFLVGITALTSNAFGYTYTIKNTTGSNITATITLAGTANSSFDIPPSTTRKESHGAYCAYSINLIANDGELAGQQTVFSPGWNTCRDMNLRVYKIGSALQVEGY